jgi:hypothetical protein
LSNAITSFNARCRRCHIVEGIAGLSGGGVLGPGFSKGLNARTKEELMKVIDEPGAVFGAGTIMPPTRIDDPVERDGLLELLLRLETTTKK